MKFEAGKEYKTRSTCDADTLVTVEVISRTDKTIKAKTQQGVKTLRVSVFNGIECVKPWGSYSMAPIVRAVEATFILTE